MINRFTSSFWFFLMLFFSRCIAENPARLWFYTHTINSSEASDTLLTPASFLNLKKDGSYTRDFGVFEWGRWEIKKDELVLTDTANVVTKIPARYGGTKDLQLKLSSDITANFEAQPSSFSSDFADPFPLVNNRWRIAAVHKETEDEIRKRLINHCQYWIAYFSWANDNNLPVLDVRSTPTLIKIYGNGFALKPYGDLPPVWRSYFYDREDCKIANNLVDEAFQYHDISWAHTENKYKMFIGGFQQLQQFLK